MHSTLEPASAARPGPTKAALHVLLALNAAAAVLSFIVDGITPSWVVYPLLLVGVFMLGRRNVRTAAVALAVAAGLFVAIHTAFVGQALKGDKCVHPADETLACQPASWIVTLGVVPFVTAVGAVAVAVASRQRDE